MNMDRHADPARLITIPLSHYCEKARWGLDRAALPYREEPHAPLLNRLAGGTVPALVQGSIRFADSTDILVHADSFRGGDLLYPLDASPRQEVESLVKRFDTELGPHTRRWAYCYRTRSCSALRGRAVCHGWKRAWFRSSHHWRVTSPERHIE